MKGEATYYEETAPSGDNFLVVLGRFIFSLIVASVGILIFLILMVVLAVLLLVGIANIQQADWYYQLYNLSGPSLSTLKTIRMVLAVGIPVIALFRWISHRHTPVCKPTPRWLSLTGIILWLIGMAMVIYSSVLSYHQAGGVWI
jgi:hypothetical protein